MGKSTGKVNENFDGSSPKHLGDYVISLPRFSNLKTMFKDFQQEEFRHLGERQKSERINRALYRLIEDTPSPCFLLAAVLDYIDHVNDAKILETYSFAHFELWLNQF